MKADSSIEKMNPEQLAAELAALGYPGFAYLKQQGSGKDPGGILIAALEQENLEARLFEALPWLVLAYWQEMDSEWLLQQATLRGVQNRLGFVVTLAKKAGRKIDVDSRRGRTLEALEVALKEHLLSREESLHEMNQAERNWLEGHRPKEARDWKLLTDWQPAMLRYVT
ncbi:MAG: hypothetical protein ACRD4O_13415 [Bryobacteraceae bacterium]